MGITVRERVGGIKLNQGQGRKERDQSVRKDSISQRGPVEKALEHRFIYLHCVLTRTLFRVDFRSMASPYAFVTLLTSDSYLPGALTLAAALKDIHPSPATLPEVDFQTVCLVTPETVDIASIKLLRKAFDLVVGVEIIEENNERGLQLLGAPSPFHVAYAPYHLPPSIPHLGTV